VKNSLYRARDGWDGAMQKWAMFSFHHLSAADAESIAVRVGDGNVFVLFTFNRLPS